MLLNNYAAISKEYASLDNSGTAFLAFKLIPHLINQYAHGKKTLDYGCGSGSSTAFLHEIGLEVSGVDISEEMIDEARCFNKDIDFQLIKSAQIPYANAFFDIVFSSFVLFEVASKKELVAIFNEIYRVLKPGGIFIAVTGSIHLYSHRWLSLDVNFNQNKNLKSGGIGKVLLKDANLVVYDYYWTDDDYQEIISESRFSKVETLYPLGEEIDGYPWLDEKHYPPYVVYLLFK